MGERMGEEELTSVYGRVLKSAAKSIYSKSARTKLKPSMRSLIVFTVQQLSWRRGKERSLTRDYWENKGWLDKRCTYYMPHGRNRVYVAIARAVGYAAAALFI